MAAACSVSEIPDTRFAKARYLHPKKGMRGKSYTFAAGVVEDIWAFDPMPFGISPREAAQMDPQQRLLLQVVWEAIEDAGVPHTALAGRRIGVYVGASSTDHRDYNTFDPGSTDPYMMTGNTMSLIANRISYIFDFNGPSFTVDTACSSSLVAMESAVRALSAGEIDTAVVGSVNALLSPFPFIGFSAAGMLSSEGLCRAFDANGAGYVRAEGAAAIVLQRTDLAPEEIRMPRKRAEIVAAGTNSDGKTVGVSLPSNKTQGALLRRLYDEANVDPDDLAFFEAHGTGTRVGDPAEAQAIGETVAQRRREPLLIGSVKSNIGHLEPAAGLAGLLKAIVAFEEGILPASLHLEKLNPDIPFEDLNLKVATANTPLRVAKTPLYAGVSTFGFGGTNAHVILRDIERGNNSKIPLKQPKELSAGGLLTLSAHGEAALRALAARYADFLDERGDLSISELSAAINRQRPHLANCLAARAKTPDALKSALRTFAEGDAASVFARDAALATGRADRPDCRIAFVFNGNSAQFAGMGRGEYLNNPAFRARFDDLSAQAFPVFGWSAAEMLMDEGLAEKLDSTAVAQPLLFVIHMTIAGCLGEFGIEPHICLGHSVGEIAAATASGALSVAQGIRVIHARSQQQETTRGKGKMAVGGLSKADAGPVLTDIRSRGRSIAVAAVNAPNAITVSGDVEAIEEFVHAVKAKGLPGKVLDLDYGFHCSLMDPIEQGLREQLKGLKPGKTRHTFISTVTGKAADGKTLDADYWWRNIREPVRFQEAVEEAFEMGCRVFIEIGPRSLFRSNLRETLGDRSEIVAIVETLKQGVRLSALAGGEETETGRHCELAALTAIACGAAYRRGKADPGAAHITLPTYPWQNKPYRLEASAETVNSWQAHGTYHMLLGHAEHADSPYWRSQIDPHVLPMLADHCVDGKVIVPGAAYAEMALAAAQRHFQTERVEIRDMDISRAIEIPDDQMIETHTEISSDASSLSISSRRRLSEDEWTTNATARIARIPGEVSEEAVMFDRKEGSVLLERDALYRIAQEYGLSYGPTFARAERIELADDDSIHVILAPADTTCEVRAGAAPFLLHPTDLDIAFHGLIALYNTDAQPEIKRGFIPIRFGRLQLFKPGIRARFARIEVNRYSPRNISANFSLYDEAGHLTARLEDARFRAASLVHRQKLADYTYSYGTRLVPHPGDVYAKVTRAPLSLPETSFLKGEWPQSEARLLLEAAAQRIAYDAVKPLAADDGIHVGTLLEQGLLLPEELPRLMSFLGICEEAGCARNAGASGNGWHLEDTVELPEAAAILRTVMTTYPAWSAECLMLSHIANHAARNGIKSVGKISAFEAATLDQHRMSSVEATGHIDTVAALVASAIAQWPETRPFRILEIGNSAGGLTRKLLPLLRRGQGTLVSCGSDRRTRGILSLATIDYPNVAIVDANELETYVRQVPRFDVVVSANGLSHEPEAESLLRFAAKAMREGGRLIVAETQPSTFHDVLFAYEEKWFARAVNPEFPLSAQRMSEEWLHVLEGAGFNDFIVHEADDESLPALLIEGGVPAAADTASNVIRLRDAASPDNRGASLKPSPLFLIAGPGYEGFAGRLAQKLGCDAHIVTVDARAAAIADDLFMVNGKYPATFDAIDLSVAGDPLDQGFLSARIKRLNGLANRFDGKLQNLWVHAPGGARAQTGHGMPSPVETGVWTYARTVRNEYPDLFLRTFDFADDLSDERKLELLEIHVRNRPAWTEAVLSDAACIELMAKTGLPVPSSDGGASSPDETLIATLAFEDLAGVDELKWELRERSHPQAGEVEVEIAATGLNFRDVMWTLGVLPDEALEDGFAGPTLGFECAGRISAVGEGVTKFTPGDPVIALGPACFSSHLTVDAISVVRLPDDFDLVAAATIPVTFLTAYYALHDLARLEENEWVLIQGGAGGVGLAALQIAQWRGARVIATAGTEEKRDLLRTLGADHVLDSRSLDFVEEVMQITGEGVDCVLNSLFGEAMERGIELLRPFGRFCELGKRDYYGNTKIGLRPFRRNITYFGIDADQLLSQKPKLAQRLFTELMEHFSSGTFSPLPYRKFDSGGIVDAFRLMQKSGHVGKIVVTPPRPETLAKAPAAKPVAFSGDGHFIVIGGLGGFGLEIAKWLGEKGVRHIVLTSRSGTVEPEQKAVFDVLERQGIGVRAVACDVGDETALAALLNDLRRTAPIKGIVHAAMVLRDALIANISEDDVDAVLSPKVRGAFNLDRLTRDDPLEAFILFSSITTFIGNPGQASYVAANGYLEGLARQRRMFGRPALAVGWGAITDVGYLARHREVGDAISKRSGTMKFTAQQALGALDLLLAHDDGALDFAALSVAPMNWSVAKGGLSILKTPPFTVLSRRADQASQGVSKTLDIAGLIEGKTEPEARAIVSSILAKEVSAVLRTPVEEVNVKRPLTDLGMDSLMGVELRMTAQQKLGIDIPLASIANGVSVDDIAKKIVARINAKTHDAASQQISELASYHLDNDEYADEIKSFEAGMENQGKPAEVSRDER